MRTLTTESRFLVSSSWRHENKFRCKLIPLEKRYTDKHDASLHCGSMYLNIPQGTEMNGWKYGVRPSINMCELARTAALRV